MSVLASVVSEGSPGSSLLMLGTTSPLPVACSVAATERVLGRFMGGLIESWDGVAFLCLLLVGIWAAESSASSPEASREDGCWRSAVEDFLIALWSVVFRFRFPEPEDDGDDMMTRRVLFRSNAGSAFVQQKPKSIVRLKHVFRPEVKLIVLVILRAGWFALNCHVSRGCEVGTSLRKIYQLPSLFWAGQKQSSSMPRFIHLALLPRTCLLIFSPFARRNFEDVVFESVPTSQT